MFGEGIYEENDGYNRKIHLLVMDHTSFMVLINFKCFFMIVKFGSFCGLICLWNSLFSAGLLNFSFISYNIIQLKLLDLVILHLASYVNSDCAGGVVITKCMQYLLYWTLLYCILLCEFWLCNKGSHNKMHAVFTLLDLVICYM